MKTVFALALLGAVSLVAVPHEAHAVGCLSGAAVGGVGGHFAGHHAILGAIGGCAVGHMMHKAQQRRLANGQFAPGTSAYPNGQPAYQPVR